MAFARVVSFDGVGQERVEEMNAMPADETPGQRTSVGKYEVAVRATG